MAKTYTQWYDSMVGIISKRYDCTVKYPRNLLDTDNMIDGLTIYFNRIDWSVHISNFVVYQMYISNPITRKDYTFKRIKEFIESRYLAMIRK